MSNLYSDNQVLNTVLKNIFLMGRTYLKLIFYFSFYIMSFLGTMNLHAFIPPQIKTCSPSDIFKRSEKHNSSENWHNDLFNRQTQMEMVYNARKAYERALKLFGEKRKIMAGKIFMDILKDNPIHKMANRYYSRISHPELSRLYDEAFLEYNHQNFNRAWVLWSLYLARDPDNLYIQLYQAVGKCLINKFKKFKMSAGNNNIDG